MIYNLILLGKSERFAKVKIETAPIESGHTIQYKGVMYSVKYISLADIFVVVN